ncbi:MAG: hypothetical protein HYV04_14850 [Deltaproteobacteria bacterium]|nr:hypothetical protein [Deltaproteobacteria bacterium]
MAIKRMQDKSREALEPTKREYNRLYADWQKRLRCLGGDPSTLGLENFRPLRLSREEDWSDWLAWLLEKSETGVLAETLFGTVMNCEAASLKSLTIEREVYTEDQERRADIVVTWKSPEGQGTHVEVKVQDDRFTKTFETAKKLEAAKPGTTWYHFILITDEVMPAWTEVGKRLHKHKEIDISSILWGDVVRGLRRCLWEGLECLVWRAWAWSFCGAIEQKLLGLRTPSPYQSEVSQLQMTLAWLDVLKL